MKTLAKLLKMGGLITALSLMPSKKAQSQFNISGFSSVNYKTENGGPDFKTLNFGGGIAYDFKNNTGIGIQYRSPEKWKSHDKDSHGLMTRMLSLNLYLNVPDQDSTKLLSGPIVGIYLNKGFPMNKKMDLPEEIHIFDKIYAGGIFLQLNFGKDFGRTHISSYIKTEGGFSTFRFFHFPLGKIRGSLSVGLRIKPHKRKPRCPFKYI